MYLFLASWKLKFKFLSDKYWLLLKVIMIYNKLWFYLIFTVSI